MDLYKEHVVAPFFVFQLFCTLLWLLDEYWYYSLFNLGMLFFFEGTVVMQRLQNMKRLRSMRKPPDKSGFTEVDNGRKYCRMIYTRETFAF